MKERAYVGYRLQSITEGSQGRNLEAGADAEAMGACWVVPLLSLLSYTTQDLHLLGSGATHSGLGSPTSIMDQTKASDLPTVSLLTEALS